VPLKPEKRAEVIARMQHLAWLLDAQFAVPLTGGRLRFGLDTLIGLVPVLGDGAMALLSLYIVAQARRLGTPWGAIFVMLFWVFVDMLLGELPVAGDIADALFKVNLRNLRMIGIEPKRRAPRA
jgi:hypothetical protein